MTDPYRPESVASLIEEVDRLLDLAGATAQTVAATRAAQRHSPGSTSTDAERLAGLVRLLGASLLAHPTTTQSVVDFLVDQGKQYTATPAGRQWQQALANSPVLDNLRTMWDETTQGVYDQVRDPSDLPSAWFEVFSEFATKSSEISLTLTQLQERGGDDG